MFSDFLECQFSWLFLCKSSVLLQCSTDKIISLFNRATKVIYKILHVDRKICTLIMASAFWKVIAPGTIFICGGGGESWYCLPDCWEGGTAMKTSHQHQIYLWSIDMCLPSPSLMSFKCLRALSSSKLLLAGPVTQHDTLH